MALADYYRRQGDLEKAQELGGEEVEEACPIIPEEEQVPLHWSNLEQIAEQLAKGYPDLNPLDLSIPNLFRRLLSLPGFEDDPDAATEEMLEKIQMLWHEEVSE
jgi:FeS assembly protein IscX